MLSHLQSHKHIFIIIIFSYLCSTNLALNQISVLNLSRVSLAQTSVENELLNQQSKPSVESKTELNVEENHTNKESTVQTSRRSVDVLLVNKINQPKEIRPQ